jgi:hypothetical protein
VLSASVPEVPTRPPLTTKDCSMNLSRFAGTMALAGFVVVAACAPRAGEPAGARPPADYLALRDTTVCVVDRTAPAGLRGLDAKVRGGDVVVFADGVVRTLEQMHPVNVIAGYAGREGWLTRGEVISQDGRRFARVGGERRIGMDLIRRAGEHQGILLFAGRDDTPPLDALYVPTAPGCIFQGYVREDLIRR